MNKMDGVKREPLGNGIEIYVSAAHQYGLDAILLADFASPRKTDIACDLGTGCGIIPLLFCRGEGGREIIGVELQPDACRLAEQSAIKNGLTGRFRVVEADLRDLKGSGLHGTCTLATCNPPYRRKSDGIISADSARAAARHEVSATIQDVAHTAAKLLKPSGRFCICHRPERLCDVISAMRTVGLEPNKLRFVSKDEQSAPWLMLLESRKCGKPGLKVLPSLITHHKNGGYSDELIKIYGCYSDSV